MPPRTGWNRDAVEARRARVAAMSRDGVTVKRIADELGVAYCTVVDDRKAIGLTKYEVRPFTVDETERITMMLDGGASYREVARTVGRHRQVIARRFPGHAWSVEQRTEYTRVLRAFGMIRTLDTGRGDKTPWERMPTVAKTVPPEHVEALVESVEVSLVDQLRELNRTRESGTERVVAYCEACRDNGHAAVLGVFDSWEIAEEYTEHHRAVLDLHDPFEYDLLEQPLFADPDEVLAAMREHIRGWRVS